MKINYPPSKWSVDDDNVSFLKEAMHILHASLGQIIFLSILFFFQSYVGPILDITRTEGILFISILELYLFGNSSGVTFMASDSLTRLVAMENVCDVI